MRRPYFQLGLLLIVTVGCTFVTRREARTHPDQTIHLIAFGSCINTNEHPMLDRFLRERGDLAVMLGDNIYADTTNMAVMRAKYHDRKGSGFWRKLQERGPVLATWDDHDFGTNDGGADYPQKREAQRLFLEFMDEPQDSERRRREGVYEARIFGPPGKRVQVVMLDTRYFRGTLSTGVHNAVPSGGPYVPTQDTNKTILGEAQWRWLETTLKEPAELRVIGSSIQFLSEFSGAEAWANMPHEKRRMLDLLEKVERGELSSMKSRVVFMSGDRHWAELSRLERPGLSPLYELTSSALTQKHPRGTPTPNMFRLGPTYHDANMGLLMIDWDARAQEKPKLRFKLLDQDGTERISEGWF
jgi:alkaline phosphatase D